MIEKPAKTTKINWQGHRGARGLLPENTTPAFLKALEFPIQTLELDVAVSKDRKIIVSHEPYFSSVISSDPDGNIITKEKEKDHNIYQLTYQQIKTYDVGSRPHPRFPEQQQIPIYKPSLVEVVLAVKSYCRQSNRPMPYWNIEIKSHPNGDDIYHPQPNEFVDLLIRELKTVDIYDKTNIQSFDLRPLQYCRETYPDMPLALLVENKDSAEKNVKRLGFQPEIYSPYFKFLNKEIIENLQQKGIKVIPWTVNEVSDMKEMKKMGVDGIITDYPNRIEEVGF